MPYKRCADDIPCGIDSNVDINSIVNALNTAHRIFRFTLEKELNPGHFAGSRIDGLIQLSVKGSATWNSHQILFHNFGLVKRK